MWGLADYYRITGEPLAGFLAQAGAASVVDAFDSYRFPDHPSWYGITEFARVTWENPESYHLGVTHQLKELNRMSDRKSTWKKRKSCSPTIPSSEALGVGRASGRR